MGLYFPNYTQGDLDRANAILDEADRKYRAKLKGKAVSETKHNRLMTALMAVGILLAFLAAVTLQGCKSPMQTAYVSRATFNTAIADVLAARKSDKIDARTFKTAVDVADTVTPVLDELDRAAIAGDTVKVWGLANTMAPRLNILVNDAIAAKGAK